MSSPRQLSRALLTRASYVFNIVRPRTIKKAYQTLKKHGMGEVMKKVRARLHFGYAAQRVQYHAYLKATRPDEAELARERQHHFAFQPFFSIVIPAYNTDPSYLQDLLDSFAAQTYRHFKLFIVDASPQSHGETSITAQIKSHPLYHDHISYTILEQNLGIAANTNQAIRLALQDPKTTHIALCDHDDYIEPDTLFLYAEALNQHPDVKIIYSDEDVVTADKDDRQAYYVMKPDFNEFLLGSCNYVNHFFACEKSLLASIKTKDGHYEQPAYDGAQDYDLYLRLTEQALKFDAQLKPKDPRTKSALYTSSTIHHIPRVLYHWRASSNSTAQDPNNKLYAFEAGKRALKDYYQRRQIPVSSVEFTDVWGTYRTKYQLKEAPLISIIIPNKDHAKDLDRAIRSIEKGTYSNVEFIIIENNSTSPETFAYYDRLSAEPNKTVVHYEGDFNYSAINNFGAEHASGDVLLLLNNDTEMIDPDSLLEMVAILERDTVGVVGAKLLYPDGKLQHAGVIVGIGDSASHIYYNEPPEFSYGNRANCVMNYSAVTGACLMVKKSTFSKVQGLSPDFAVNFNDVDFCLKIRSLGLGVVYTPHASFYHYESKSRGYEITAKRRETMLKEAALLRERWPEIYRLGDPYYNPNFSLERTDCSLRDPKPRHK